MAEHTPSTGPILCPSCGEPMQILSTLEGGDRIAVCAACSDQAPISIRTSPQSAAGSAEAEPEINQHAAQDRTARSRVRELLRESEMKAPAAWPDELLEDLPEETRALLQRARTARDSGTVSLLDEYMHSLRAQGYVVTEDVRGVRISGAPKGRGTSELSPSDLVRMAAELDGGILPQDKRRPCPQCQATIPPSAQQCQWCGYVLPAEGES